MGYSCAALASFTFEKAMELLRDENAPESTNCWVINDLQYMVERGREQPDGAITGTVFKFIENGQITTAGSVRIEPNGEITRFPTLSKKMREKAFAEGTLKYREVFQLDNPV